jgi:hypothetical protein
MPTRLFFSAALLVATSAAPTLDAATQKAALDKAELMHARDKLLTVWCANALYVGTFPCKSNAILKRVRATKDPAEKKQVRMR